MTTSTATNFPKFLSKEPIFFYGEVFEGQYYSLKIMKNGRKFQLLRLNEFSQDVLFDTGSARKFVRMLLAVRTTPTFLRNSQKIAWDAFVDEISGMAD